jgi:hypothetical protein
MNINSKSINYWKMQLIKKAKEDSIDKKNGRWNLKKKKLFGIIIKSDPMVQP